MKALIFQAVLIALVCGDASISVNLKRSINEISTNFISSHINFYNLLNLAKNRKNFTAISPSYLKIEKFSEFLANPNVNNIKQSDVGGIFKSLHQNQITPVIVIEYNISNFEPIALLNKLKAAKNLDIKECVWQLGENPLEFSDSISMKRYSDDLKTLKILCESVKRDSKLDWNVAAVGSFAEKVAFNVEGYDFGKYTQGEILSKSAITDSKRVWATIKEKDDVETFSSSKRKSHGSCDETCAIDGLLYANVLGESAKNGIDVLFFESQVPPNELKLAINKMHNALIGTRIFNVRNLKSSSKHDSKQPSVYGYCTKKSDGAVTLMGINYSNTRAKINAKLSSSSIDSNSVVSQYLLSVSNGHVFLNNEKFNGTITPAYKFKKITKHFFDFTIPPFSIVFWVIKNANAKECVAARDEKTQAERPLSSSSDNLLLALAGNVLENSPTRSRRQIGNPIFPKFDLFSSLMQPSNINPRSIKDALFNKNTEIYKVSPVNEVNPLQSSENPSLPNGDVFLLVNDGSNDDYIHDDVVIEYPRRKNSRKSNKEMMFEASEAPEYILSHDYIEASHKATIATKKGQSKKSQKPQQQQQRDLEIGELFEIEKPSINVNNNDQMRSSNRNVEIKTVTKELEPTYRQSKKAILAAKRKWDQSRLMELLKDATLEEVDKNQIQNPDDFQMIDITDDELNYDEYENEDDDGFFTDDKVRTKRSPKLDYRTNEIPKFGDHIIDDSEEVSIETLVDDIHLFPLSQRETERQTTTSTTTTERSIISSGENAPLGIKIIDVFSKSLDDINLVIHRNIKAWWYTFSED